MRMTFKKGPRAGWIYGGLGGLIWMPVIGLLLLLKEYYFPAFSSLLFFGLGLLYIRTFAPWKHANVSLGLIYAGLALIIFSACVVIFLLWFHLNPLHTFSCLVFIPVFIPLLILFLPALLFRKRSWKDIHQSD